MLPSSYFWQGSYYLSVSSPIWLPCIHHQSTASHLNGYCVESWGPLGNWSWIFCCLEQSSAEQFSASTLGSRNHSGDHRHVPVDKEKHIDSHQLRKNSRKTIKQGKNGETLGWATEEGSLTQDWQTCNRCYIQTKTVNNTECMGMHYCLYSHSHSGNPGPSI